MKCKQTTILGCAMVALLMCGFAHGTTWTANPASAADENPLSVNGSGESTTFPPLKPVKASGEDNVWRIESGALISSKPTARVADFYVSAADTNELWLPVDTSGSHAGFTAELTISAATVEAVRDGVYPNGTFVGLKVLNSDLKTWWCGVYVPTANDYLDGWSPYSSAPTALGAGTDGAPVFCTIYNTDLLGMEAATPVPAGTLNDVVIGVVVTATDIQFSVDGTNLGTPMTFTAGTFDPTTISVCDGFFGDATTDPPAYDGIAIVGLTATGANVPTGAPSEGEAPVEGEGEGEGESGGGGECWEVKYDALMAAFNEQLMFVDDFWGVVIEDWDGGGITDWFDLALLAKAMCDYPEAQAVFDSNVSTLTFWGQSDSWNTVWAALATLSTEGNAVASYFTFGTPFTTWDTGSKTATQPLSPSGDYDNDGQTNLQEYQQVIAAGRGVDVYVQAASSSSPFWPGNPELPVAGFVGLGLLSGLLLVGGARLSRTKKD